MEHEIGPGEGESPFLPLRSEDSGLGISASPSELHLLPGAGLGPEEAGIVKESEGVWRKGGSVETITQYLQDILAFIISRYLLVQVEDVRGQEEAVQSDPAALSPGRKSSFREGPQITTTQIKDKLAELFTPNKHKPRATSDPPVPDPPTERKKGRRCAGGGVDWGAGYMPRSRAEISEECRQAFTAACHLLLESTTFPLYLSEGESHGLYNDMFNHTGSDVDSLPVWLRSLMTLCCLSRDYHVQHTAMSSLLELINHSRSLALVIQDKTRRYQASDANPLSGRLQMVTMPPIYPGLLSTIEQGTDFYQRVAQVLWCQLDMERREQHTSCVELFYRLHCLAPSASICEDIICQALLHRDKVQSTQDFTVLSRQTVHYTPTAKIHPIPL
ncbi:unnamed protein product [Oncorhynchus mykiss]|uniref:Uncharacterized protein n=1 Tax=Oncorhynchus mykiss TaxID=8022 RepID=A0A060WN70_ONCMY|nr:unnamed protein product [Oncorhynchus mykiss]